jgi:prepilin-type N-terminal cleavage/methylation domain-containing protein
MMTHPEQPDCRAHRRCAAPHHTHRRGLSLVEVLASLALVAIVLPVAMRSISAATNASSVAAQRTQATILAQSKLDEMVIAHDYTSPQQQGDFGSDWPNHRWTATASDFDTLVKQIDLTVTWMSHAGERSVTLTTLVYTDG